MSYDDSRYNHKINKKNRKMFLKSRILFVSYFFNLSLLFRKISGNVGEVFLNPIVYLFKYLAMLALSLRRPVKCYLSKYPAMLAAKTFFTFLQKRSCS